MIQVIMLYTMYLANSTRHTIIHESSNTLKVVNIIVYSYPYNYDKINFTFTAKVEQKGWLEKSAALPLVGYPHGHQLVQGVAE